MIQVTETYIVKDTGYSTTLYKCNNHDSEWPHAQSTIWMLQAMRATCNETYGLIEISEQRAHDLLGWKTEQNANK